MSKKTTPELFDMSDHVAVITVPVVESVKVSLNRSLKRVHRLLLLPEELRK